MHASLLPRRPRPLDDRCSLPGHGHAHGQLRLAAGVATGVAATGVATPCVLFVHVRT